MLSALHTGAHHGPCAGLEKEPGLSPGGKSVRENGALERTMGGLFFADPCELSREDCVEILNKSYR